MVSSYAAARAERAAAAVTAYGTRLWFLPTTHLSRAERPWHGVADKSWNYWWQAHYLDAMVDAGMRELRGGDVAAARRWHRLGLRLLRTVWLRQGRRWSNHFYDDMAWLALSSHRLDGLGRELGRRPSATVASAARTFDRDFRDAADCPLGGCWWNHERRYVNVATTAPVALWRARTGATAEARRLADWLLTQLRDPETGLVRDGLEENDGQRRVDEHVWTYNQGTTIGLLLALGEPADLREAAALVAAVAAHLTVAPGILRTDGTGDGGLFTGILTRYLALAARDERLSQESRATAAALVRGTAEALWGGRGRLPGGQLVFPVDPLVPALEAARGGPVAITPQLQAWTALEAAATL